MNKVIKEGTLRLLITESTCDVILSCSDHRLMAHKLVLSIASPVLRELLRKHSSDSTSVLILPDVNSSTMSNILDYIYTGTTVVYSQALEEFLSVAKFLQIVIDTKNIENILDSFDRIKKQDDGELMDCTSKKLTNIENNKESNENTPAKCEEEKYSSRKPQKSLPDLLPIDTEKFRSNTQRKMCNVVVPSPWCPRNTRSYLRDPRSVTLKSAENEEQNCYLEDTNNNFQLTHNKESSKPSAKRLDTIIRHLYLKNPEVRKEKISKTNSENLKRFPEKCAPPSEKFELPKFTNFPFSRHLADLLPLNKTHYEGVHKESKTSCVNKQLCLEKPSSINTVQDLSASKNTWSFTQSSPTYLPPASPLHSPTAKNASLPRKIKDVSNETVPNFNDSSNSIQDITNDNSNDNSIGSDSSHNDKKEESESVRKKAFKCEDCGKSFSQLRNYKYHRSIHAGTKEFSAKCAECGKTFNDRGYLSSHMKIHRDRKEYACPDCPKRFNQRVAYNMHLRIHTGVKPHECPTCGKSFSRKMLLKQHQRVHTGERPYSCPECGKTFADRSNMSLHARLHTGVKPYACNLCPKSFTKKHHLKTHMNFHTGLKPYTCENCGLAFSQSSNMRTHYKKCILKDKHDDTSKAESSADNNSS